MMRAIRGLAVAGLVAVGLAAWTSGLDGVIPGVFFATQAFAERHVGVVGVLLLPMMASTGTLLSFAAGVLALAQAVQSKRHAWAAALLAVLFLYGAAPFLIQVWLLLQPPPRIPDWWFNASPVVIVISVALAPAAPALVALAYSFRSPGNTRRRGAGEPRHQHRADLE